MICPHCNNNIPDGLAACYHCGKPLNEPVQQTRLAQEPIRPGQTKVKNQGLPVIIAAAAIVLLLGGAVGGHFMGFYSLPFLPDKAVTGENTPPAIGGAFDTATPPENGTLDTATPSEQSAEQPMEQPAEQPTEQPAEQPDEQPVEQSVESYPAPVFTEVRASDVLASSGRVRYNPELVLDGRLDTAWAVAGSTGHWIELHARTEQYVTGIKILNGYTKYYEAEKIWLYHANNRPRDIRIAFSDGTHMNATLDDVFNEVNPIYQDIRFDAPKKTTSVRIYIDSVYSGNRWDDTCISSLEVY